MTRRRSAAGDKGITEPTADFAGLIDLVWNEQDSRVEFWCLGFGGGVRSRRQHLPHRFTTRVPATGGGTSGKATIWVPPPKSALPWLLPRRKAVEAYFAKDTDEEYFAALCKWIDSQVQLPKPQHTTLLAAWIAHSYIVDLVYASPYILLLGPPETGKTRVLETCIHAARRGVLMPDAREATLIRYTAHYHATLAIDVLDFSKAIASCMDIFAARTKNNGTVTTRVIDPTKGPFEGGIVQFIAYGATIVASNVAPSNEVIASRTLPIQMHEEVDHPGRQPITPDLALPLRERGTAFRARMLMRAADQTLPTPPLVARGRLGEIMSPLALVVHVCAPTQVSVLEALALEFEHARRVDVRDTTEVELLQHCIALFEAAADGGASVSVPLRRLVQEVNMDREASGERALGSKRISATLRTHFEIEVWQGTGNARHLTLSERRLTTLSKKYGLEFRPPGAQRQTTEAATNPAPVVQPRARRHKAAPAASVASQPVTDVTDRRAIVNGRKPKKPTPNAHVVTQVNQVKKKKKKEKERGEDQSGSCGARDLTGR